MKDRKMFITLFVLILVSLSCSLFGGAGPSSSQRTESEFPVPPGVENVTELNGSFNFQVSMSLSEVVAFYRGEFEKSGYVEREILTSVEDTTFSIVWDGHPSGQAVVVQGVDLGNGTTNVNIRLEDV
jgi:hypothetical protein